ncbi:Reverse transcriptase RNA-dependent DNA polymerase [Arabidopsis suecica]|uniref:Reverse transcriptase RNA-dependent DNA polymerase n=1 Tax=Arabidopsis suecica TaxID=45249 RepID=A0A8T1YP47_ARASU|nr:Reverse transcriptase RNA-dependent DNA polymerase [Arabidopsis suecica]
MFILLMLQEVNLMQNLTSVTLLVMVTPSLVIGSWVTKIRRSFAAGMLYSRKKHYTRIYKLKVGSESKESRAVDLGDILILKLQDTVAAEEQEAQGDDIEVDRNDETIVIPHTPITGLQRTTRVIKHVVRYSPSLHYVLFTDRGELECYEEALQVEKSIKRELTREDEMDSQIFNHTWNLTELHVEKKVLHNKWIYRIKEKQDGSKRYKARRVVKGFQQKRVLTIHKFYPM